MKSFLRKDTRSAYFIFHLLFLVGVLIFVITDSGITFLRSVLLISIALLNGFSAGYLLYEVRKEEWGVKLTTINADSLELSALIIIFLMLA